MALFKTRKRDRFWIEMDGDRHHALRSDVFDRFGPTILGLGELETHSKATEAICAMFDLGGFTDFCRQVDPHLTVPVFMRAFLGWLFRQLKTEAVREIVAGGSIVWTPMPFFAKFMGDGVLFLWSTDDVGYGAGVANVAVCMNHICDKYEKDFLPFIRTQVARPPTVLRCGVARGRVYSIGDGRDFVGPCINIAARLQKLAPGLTFAFSPRGFDLSDHDCRESYLLRQVNIRGIGDGELVYVDKQQFAALAEEQRALFREP